MNWALALTALVALVPLMLAIALLVLLARDGPVLFAHERIGRDGRRFNVLKFRTMRSEPVSVLAARLAADDTLAREWAATHKLRRDPRVTRLGEVLRKFSLDELPQLVNVLRGEMSLVGPRPIVAEEMVKYGPHLGAYLSVRPGITGVWQVSGRSDLCYQTRVEMDARYAREKTLLLDLKLMAATIPAILTCRGSC